MSTQRQAQATPTPAKPPPAWRVAADREANGTGLHFGQERREPWDYVPVPPFVVDDDGYLMDDARPMTNRHAVRMLAYGTVLKERYRGRGMVGVELSMHYMEGSPGKTLAPDLFVALAAEHDEQRSSYKLWQEPAPDFVLEDLSPSTRRRDAVDKRALYQRFGVREYFMFEETGKRLRDDSGSRLGVTLVGYRLRLGEYEPIPGNDEGRLPSEVLGLELCVKDDLVRFYDPAAGEYLRTYGEVQAQLAEERARRAEAERREDVEAHRTEQAKTAAALARVAELEAELKARRSSD